MSEEKRVFCDYTVEQSIFVGNKEVLLGVDKKNTQEHRFMVCYCSYDNPLGVPWPTEAVGTDDYLEAMQVFLDRVQAQVELVRGEQEKYQFDMTPFTIDDCIPDDRKQSIVGKVVVINAEPKRYEYQHSAYQLVLADGGNGATGGRGPPPAPAAFPAGRSPASGRQMPRTGPRGRSFSRTGPEGPEAGRRYGRCAAPCRGRASALR